MRKLARNGLAVVGTVVIVYYALVGLYKLRPLAEDEAPIRVRNGSLDILVGEESGKRWRWKRKDGDDRDSTPSYSHEPDHGGKDEDICGSRFPDKSDASCRSGEYVFSGDRVILEYQEANSKFIARLRRGKRAVLGVNYRTKVRPKDNYALEGKFLRYKGVGYIAEVSAVP